MSQREEFEAWYAEHGWKYVSSREGAFLTWKAATEAMRKRVSELEKERDALEFSWAGCSRQLKDACADLDAVEAERDALKQQRDELLAALEEALPMVPCGSFSDKKLTELAEGGHLTAAMILRHRSTIAIVKEKA